MPPLSDALIEFLDQTPELVVGGDQVLYVESTAESGNCPLEVLLFVVKRGHLDDVFVCLLLKVLEVDRVLLIELSHLKGVDLIVHFSKLEDSQGLETADSASECLLEFGPLLGNPLLVVEHFDLQSLDGLVRAVDLPEYVLADQAILYVKQLHQDAFVLPCHF